MRLSVKRYENGNAFAAETNDDGSEIVDTLKGDREVGKRISAFLEIICDDDAAGVQRAIDELGWLQSQMKHKLEAYAKERNLGAARPSKSKSKN